LDIEEKTGFRMDFFTLYGRFDTQRKAVLMNVDLKRQETLEQLAAEGDECAVAELWQVFGVDRHP
jgi:hypothetical protein